jgi:ABC-type Zn uptake system ZnuABC Zn-binding protein ZnuA/ABC-type Mn2+/Zn2+ transport system permease subunit
MLESLALPFVQKGIVEILFLGVAAGLVGTWIVLRGLAFFAHAVSAASFPGLVVADGLAFSAHAGAAGTAGIVAAWVGWLSRRHRDYDVATALVLVGALSVGVVLASDVFHSASSVERMLFGSLLLVDGSDIALAAVAAGIVAATTFAVGARWLATGFDPGSARALGVRAGLGDAILLALVGLVAIASLSAIGALLATALLVVPAATTRLVFERMGPWQAATVGLACLEGVVGLLVSVELNVPPGPAIAVLTGAVFVLVAVVRTLRPRRAVLAAAGLLAVLGAGGCGSAPSGGGGGALDVVATTTQLGDIVRAIGGDAVDVHQILQPNTDPHDYEPRPGDVIATAGAKVVFESGGHLDEWMGEILEQSGGQPAIVVAGDRAVDRDAEDPHWWHDPRNVAAAIPAIRDALIAADPAQLATYRLGAREYAEKVRALDRGIARCFAAVPAARRKLVTDHDAFGYFARRYGIRVIGAVLPATTTQAQPSAGTLADLVELVRRERVRAVFPESSANGKLAEAIAERTGATAEYELYGDTLGPEGSDGDTYLGMERHNADAMVRGFTGGRAGCTIQGL